jgi:hypothetical protein
MFGRIAAIALNTYRESVRARILLGLAGVAFMGLIYAVVVGAFTLTDQARVVSDVSTAVMSIVAIAVAIVIGATSLHRELEQKTVFPILARPIRRAEYIIGKFLGTLLTIGVFIIADAALILFVSALVAGRGPELVFGALGGVSIALAVAAWRFPPMRTYGLIPWSLLLLVSATLLSSNAIDERRVILSASALAFLEVAIVSAIATLFSSFSTPFLSALLTIGMWILGRQSDSLARLPAKFFGEAIAAAGKGLARVVPNLQTYVPPRPLLTGEALEAHLGQYMLMATLQSLAWAVGLLAVASLVFKRRDFL